MGTLSITRKTSNTLITASGFNTNYDEIEAVINGAIEAANIAADAVTAAKINSDVVRSGYGLVQHTDGSLYVDVSDTNPGLEISDGGVRIKSYGLAQRTSNGLDIGRSGDLLLTSAASTPDGWTDVTATYSNKFIRINATALSTGGADTHTHAVGTYAVSGTTGYESNSSNVNEQSATTGRAIENHTHTFSASVTGTSASGDNVPAYVTSKLLKKD